MFALPDYGENTIFPPASSMPSSETDAHCMRMMQLMMAESYIQGRKYWAQNSHTKHGAPNESQAEVEKFLEFTALLPKRERLTELRPAVASSDEGSSLDSEELVGNPEAQKERPRWKRYISLPSSSCVPTFLRSKSSTSRLRSMSLPLISKIKPFPVPRQLLHLSRTSSQPPHTRATPQTPKPPVVQRRRFTLDESQMALAKTRVDSPATAPSSPLSYSPRIPRFPCEYLPLIPTTRTPKRRQRPAKGKPESPPTDSLVISASTDTRPLSFDRNPPPGSPGAIRKIPLPPPEWFDTPFPEEEMEMVIVSDPAIEEEIKIRWYHILFMIFLIFFAIIAGACIALLFLSLEILFSLTHLFSFYDPSQKEV